MKDEIKSSVILLAILILLVANFDKILSVMNVVGDELVEFNIIDNEVGPLERAYKEYVHTMNSESLKNSPEEIQREIVEKTFNNTLEQIGDVVLSKAATKTEKEIAAKFKESIKNDLAVAANSSFHEKDFNEIYNKAMDEVLKKAVKIIALNSADDIIVNRGAILKSIEKSIADIALKVAVRAAGDDSLVSLPDASRKKQAVALNTSPIH